MSIDLFYRQIFYRFGNLSIELKKSIEFLIDGFIDKREKWRKYEKNNFKYGYFHRHR